MITKVCTGCGLDKALDEYYDGIGRYNKRAKCKVCYDEITKRRKRERYATDFEYRENDKLNSRIRYWRDRE